MPSFAYSTLELLLRVWIIIAIEVVVFAAILFGGAGTLAWPSGWIFLIVMFGSAILATADLVRRDPGLVEERLKPLPQKDQPLWDKILLPVLVTVFVPWLALMGIDAVRFRWSVMPRWLQTVGAALVVLSIWAQYLVFRENSFAAPVVKIQRARGQRVISTGPYAVVRHPMYSSAIVFLAGTALLLGSWWGLLGSLALDGLFALRTALEDRELHAGLEGYDCYAERVPYKLIPRIW